MPGPQTRIALATFSIGWLLALAGCGGAGHSSGSKAVAAGVQCVSSPAASGAIGTAAQEPATGVSAISGSCWAQITGTPITEAVIGSMPAGASATWKAAWTPQDLYVYADVVTERAVINTNTGAPWEDDSVEIYLSGTNDHSGAYPGLTGQLLINSGGLTNSTLGTDHAALPTTHATATEQTSSTGYQILLSMPWGNLGVSTPAQGTKIGFTIGVDFPGTGAAHRADGGGQVMWQGTSTNWESDAAWGVLQLG